MAATMAQSTFGLQPSTNDDTMEISSDLGNVDGDIDIDLDSAGEQMQFEDDDQMVDDVKTDPITHHDDDVMIDDEVTSNPGDREMQDDSVLPPQQEHDEELLDFSDDDDDTYANRAPPISAPAVPSLLSAAQSHVEPSAPIIQEPVQDHDTKSIQEHVTEASLATVQEPEDQVSSEAAAELVTEGAPVVDHISQHDEEHQQPQIVVAPEDQAQPTSQDAESVHEAAHIGHDGHAEAHAVGSPEPSVHQGEERYESVTEDVNEQPGDVDSFAEIVTQPLEQPAEPHAGGTAEPATNDDTSDRPEAGQTDGSGPDSHEVTRTLNVDTAPTNHGDADDAPAYERQPNSPTATGLHPTVVEYNENEIYLFPSSDPEATEQYLLGNENLVTSSLGDLLQACRSVLAESISDDEELVLGVQELDLYVSEDSTPAFSISFQELLDVYLQLHKHDGMVHPPPFRVTLTTKTRFTNRLNMITQAIAEGKGFSQLDFLQQYEIDEAAGFPEEEDFDDDSYHEIGAGDFQDGSEADGEQAKAQETNAYPEESNNDQDQNDSVEQHVEEHDDPQEAGNEVSEYTAEGDQEYIENVEQPGEPAQATDAQDDAQHDNVEPEDVQEEAEAPVQHNDAESVEPYQEDHHSGQEEPTFEAADEEPHSDVYAAAEGEMGLAEADLEGEYAHHDAEDIPTPPQDDDFNEEDFAEEETSYEEHKVEQNETEHGSYVGIGRDEDRRDDGHNGANPSDANVATSDDANRSQSSNEQGDARTDVEGDTTAQDAEDERQAQYEHDLDEAFDDDHVGETEGTAREPTGEQNDPHKNGDVASMHDPDEIDFDDDEEFNDDQNPAQGSDKETASEKMSPSIKRSFSERHEAADSTEDEQALKKVKSS